MNESTVKLGNRAMKDTTGATDGGGGGIPAAGGGGALEVGGVRRAAGGLEATAAGGGCGDEHIGPLAVTVHTRSLQQVPVLQKVPTARQEGGGVLETLGGVDWTATGGGAGGVSGSGGEKGFSGKGGDGGANAFPQLHPSREGARTKLWCNPHARVASYPVVALSHPLARALTCNL